jgi:CheY-like chemotaxis protein
MIKGGSMDSYKVLVVDDNSNLRDDLIRSLSEALPGWEVNEASNVEQAKMMLENNDYSIVVTDMNLDSTDIVKGSGMQGLEIAKLAKYKNKKTIILVVTSYFARHISSFERDKFLELEVEFLSSSSTTQDNFVGLFKYQLERSAKTFSATKNTPNISELWSLWNDTRKHSYWILMMNGYHLPTDRKILAEVLFWQSVICRYEAAFWPCCPNDLYYATICKLFSIKTAPALIISANASMEPSIQIKEHALGILLREEEGLCKFLNKVQLQLKNHEEIGEIKLQLKAKEYWDWFSWTKDEFGEFMKYIF